MIDLSSAAILSAYILMLYNQFVPLGLANTLQGIYDSEIYRFLIRDKPHQKNYLSL